MYAFLRWIVRMMTRGVLLGGLLQVEGRSRVPRRGGLLVCSNHCGNLEAPMIPAFLPRRDSWSMAKAEWFKPGLLGWLFTVYQCFPVVRHSPDRRALRRSFEILGQGQALAIFPEGSRELEGVLVKPEAGAGYLAIRSRVPVLPVAVTGTRECMPKGARLPRRVPIQITFGAPFRIRERRPGGTKVTNAEAAEAIMLAIAELLPADRRGLFADIDGIRARLAGVYESTL